MMMFRRKARLPETAWPTSDANLINCIYVCTMHNDLRASQNITAYTMQGNSVTCTLSQNVWSETHPRNIFQQLSANSQPSSTSTSSSKQLQSGCRGHQSDIERNKRNLQKQNWDGSSQVTGLESSTCCTNSKSHRILNVLWAKRSRDRVY